MEYVSPIHIVPTLSAPEQVEPIRKRRGNRKRPRVYSPAFIIGAIILLDDGSQCQIVSVNQTGAYCIPLTEHK